MKVFIFPTCQVGNLRIRQGKAFMIKCMADPEVALPTWWIKQVAHLECIKRQKLRSTKEFPRGLQMIVKTGVVKAARILIEMNPRASRAAEARAGEGPVLKARKEAPTRVS